MVMGIQLTTEAFADCCFAVSELLYFKYGEKWAHTTHILAIHTLHLLANNVLHITYQFVPDLEPSQCLVHGALFSSSNLIKYFLCK